jgi:hypothetical protein
VTQEASANAYVPLSFDPVEAYQFDWSHEVVILDGVTATVKVAHVRLCHSRMPFVRAYPRETQEMVLDAHDKAFAFFDGACARGIYDSSACDRHRSEAHAGQDGGGHDLRRQGSRLQSPLPADVRALSGRSCCLLPRARAGRRVRSRTRSACCDGGSSCRGRSSDPMRS